MSKRAFWTFYFSCVACWLVLTAYCAAQVGQIIHPSQMAPAAAPTSSYVGPGDVASATAWWGLRAYSNAKAAALANIAIITRASDSTTCTVKSDINGNLDLVGTPCAGATTIGTWCTADTCSVTTLYDQAGAHNMTAPGALSTAPVLTFNCLNTSKPCMTHSKAAATCMSNTAFGTVAQPYTFSAVWKRTGDFTSQGYIVGFTSRLGYEFVADQMVANATNPANIGVADNALHAANALFNGASSMVNLDGTESAAPGIGTGSIGVSKIGIGAYPNGCTQNMSGVFAEAGVWGSTTATERGNLCQNQYTYWATLHSCANYVGPADVMASPVHYWGLRAVNATNAAAHANIAIITRAADSTTCTVVAATDGSLDLVGTPCAGSTTIGTWCTGDTCSVTTLYDQGSGGNNMVQATLSKAPVLTFNCLNTNRPCMTFTATASQCMSDGETGTLAQPGHMLAVARRTANFTTQQGVLDAYTTSGGILEFYAAANDFVFYFGTSVTRTLATDNVFHTYQAMPNTTSSADNINGTDRTGLSPGSAAFTFPWNLSGRNTCASQFLTGNIAEAVFWGSTSTTGQRQPLCHNAYSHWLTGTPC